ncbi:MFS transporter [Kineosporia sp. NBRC 101677]|uniref:MFS transporter n=1 Tax=Kineosporia sp. NBRC 101677 TaxID=3032197 RepID=UPI0024A16113|nr:MFS transporter [Kineosporia sp. NBRC 101677]GLY19809.1 MFS transporter [Kineosporia sp. NBRC 101677]
MLSLPLLSSRLKAPAGRRDPVLSALFLSSAATATALGLGFTLSALYLTRVAGIPSRTVGVGLTVAGVFAIATTFLAGRLSDRYGARAVMIGAALVQSAALAGYCLLDGNVAAFVLLAAALLGAQGVHGTAKVTLVAQAFSGGDRTATRARIRVVTNVFVAAGSGLGAIVLAIGTASAYRTGLVVAALLVLGSILPLASLTMEAAAPVTPAHAPSSSAPLRDRRYLAVTALNGVIHVQFEVLTLGLPLWVAGHTEAPEALIGGLIVLNTVVVTMLQVPATRWVTDVDRAGRTVFGATGMLALACVLYPVAGALGALTATAVLVAAVVVHSLGEVLSEAGGWELAFELADPARPGAYQGVSQTGAAVGAALAPAVITSSALAYGLPGWLLLGGAFLAAGAGTRALSRDARP